MCINHHHALQSWQNKDTDLQPKQISHRGYHLVGAHTSRATSSFELHPVIAVWIFPPPSFSSFQHRPDHPSYSQSTSPSHRSDFHTLGSTNQVRSTQFEQHQISACTAQSPCQLRHWFPSVAKPHLQVQWQLSASGRCPFVQGQLHSLLFKYQYGSLELQHVF